jgi:hypothetical protein
MRPWIPYALTLALGSALGAWLVAWLYGLRARREGQARNRRGKRGEQRAAELLEAAGFRIVERQRRSAYRMQVNASALDVGVTFDFVVMRDGRELIAEVKTGSLVTRLRHADTRRQLLEYQLVSGAGPVLLVDPERATITEVSFPLATASASAGAGSNAPEAEQQPPPAGASWAFWGCALALVIVVCAALYRVR